MKSFEYDEQKSVSNFSKHGIDFKDAQKLWMDELPIEVKLRFDDEPRYIVVGFIDFTSTKPTPETRECRLS